MIDLPAGAFYIFRSSEKIFLILRMKTDRPLGLDRFFNQFFNRIKDNFELMVVFLLHFLDFLFQPRMRAQHLPQLGECPHDLDVNLNRAIAI